MSNKKTYQIILNPENTSEKFHQFTYSYSQTNITLQLCENYIDISMEMKTKDVVDFDHIFQPKSNGFHARLNDAVKRAFLIHFIKYSKHIDIRTVTAKIDEDEKVIFDFKENSSINFPIFSLINGSLLKGHEFPESWGNSKKIDDVILSRRLSYFNSLDSALFALIYAKSKEYETERLVYLWMAMNGMYNHFAKMIDKFRFQKYLTKKGKSTLSGDKSQIEVFLQFYNLGKNIPSQQQRAFVAWEVIAILRHYRGNITKKMLLPDIKSNKYNNRLAIAIHSRLKNLTDKENNPIDITPYGFLLFVLPYYYRCNVFHANKPVYFFAYEDETNIHCLHIINNLMEEFLNEHLIEWFEDDFVTAVDNKSNKLNIDEMDSPIKAEIRSKFSNNSD